MLLSSLLGVGLRLSLVNTVLSAVVVGGGEDCGDSSVSVVISLSALALTSTLLPLLIRFTLLSVVEVVSVLGTDLVFSCDKHNYFNLRM